MRATVPPRTVAMPTPQDAAGRARTPNAQSMKAPLGDPSVVDVVVVDGVIVVGTDVVGGTEVVGADVVGGGAIVVVVDPTTHVALQQLPEPTMPPRASHFSAVDLTEHLLTTEGQSASTPHAVEPSSQSPSVHVPDSQIAHVTKPSFFPQVERAAHRVTAPLQFASTSPFRTASRTA